MYHDDLAKLPEGTPTSPFALTIERPDNVPVEALSGRYAVETQDWRRDQAANPLNGVRLVLLQDIPHPGSRKLWMIRSWILIDDNVPQSRKPYRINILAQLKGGSKVIHIASYGHESPDAQRWVPIRDFLTRHAVPAVAALIHADRNLVDADFAARIKRQREQLAEEVAYHERYVKHVVAKSETLAALLRGEHPELSIEDVRRRRMVDEWP